MGKSIPSHLSTARFAKPQQQAPKLPNHKFIDALIGVCLLLIYFLLVSCATTRPLPPEVPPLVSTVRHQFELPPLPDTLPKMKPTLLQRVFGGSATKKVKSTTKFKGPTTIIMGNGNNGGAATKPGTVATGTGAVATDARKAHAPVVVGKGNQVAASSDKAPAVAGNGNIVVPLAPSNWWKWLLTGIAVGIVVRHFGAIWLLQI